MFNRQSNENRVYDITYYPEEMLCVAIARKTIVTERELIEANIDEIIYGDGWITDMNCINDMRKIEFIEESNIYSAIKMAQKIRRNHESIIGDSNLAIVASNELVYGKVKQFLAIRRNKEGEYRVFYDLYEAADWLGLTDLKKYSIDP